MISVWRVNRSTELRRHRSGNLNLSVRRDEIINSQWHVTRYGRVEAFAHDKARRPVMSGLGFALRLVTFGLRRCVAA